MNQRQQQSAWHEIKDPDGDQKDIFEASKAVYGLLFSPEHREDWSHFREYILDTQRRLSRDPQADPLDYYYVATSGKKVHGMAFFSTYRQKRLGFISYFGVLSPQVKKSKKLAYDGALKIRSKLRKENIEGILFEAEMISPESLSKRGRWTQQRLASLDCLQEAGARKISWLLYEQPGLELDAATPEATNLHLMCLSTSRVSETAVTASRRTVERYLDFVYNTFYFDGFEVTDTAKLRQAKDYLASLFHRVLRSLPEGAKEIPLIKVNLRPRGITIFISYTSDGLLLAKLLASCLEDMGIRVIFWEKDAPHYAGSELHSTVRHWVQTCDLFIALFSRQSLISWGMVEELGLAVSFKKHTIVLLSKDMKRRWEQELKSRIIGLLGPIIYESFEERRFDLAITAVIGCIERNFPPELS